MDDFWAHSICVAVTAKSLASIKDVPRTQREEYFVCGLLHDLGKIPLNNYLSDGYLRALESCRSEQGPPLNEAENAVFGFDHCLVGKMITEKWGLGQTIIDSLAYHHNPDDANEESSEFVTIVSLANTFANSLAIGSAGDHVPEDSLITYLLDKAGVSQSSLTDLRENVLDDIEKAKVFLQFGKRG
jgi:putative nucleotidyltransferase with HDIG domain